MSDLLHLPALSWRALAVWRRNVRVWLKGAVWSSVFGDILEPAIWLTGLGYGLGAFINQINGTSYIAFVAPGLLCMGAMWSASFENTYGSFTRMDRQKTYSAIMVTPVSIQEVVAGDILWGATKGTLSGAMMLLVASALGLTDLPQALWCLPLAGLLALVFASISLTLTALSNSYDFFTYYFTIGLTPLIIVSGVWFPQDGLPEALRFVAEGLPLTHAVRIARAAMSGTLTPTLLPSVFWLLLYLFVFFTFAVNLVRKRLIT